MKRSLFLLAISVGIIASVTNCNTAKKGTKKNGRAIIHRTKNQEKLDSIKSEKQKGKL